MPAPLARCLLLLLLLGAGAVAADVLELRDGRVLEGRLAASNGERLRFETEAGSLEFPVAEVAVLRFGPRDATGSETSGSAPGPRDTVQVPAGTRIRVRVKDSLDPRRSAAGDAFSARVEDEIRVGDRIVVPRSAVAYGVVSTASPTGPAAHRLRLELKALQLQGRRIELVTGPHSRVAEAPPGDAPAKAADPNPVRVPAGALLEFLLLQPLDL